MKAIELIDKMYKRTKNNALSHFAKKLMLKHDLTEESEIDTVQAVLICAEISNKEKRIELINSIMSNFEQVANTEKADIDIRKESYKQTCKYFHPDNTETGSESMFKFIQEMKEYLWDFKGVPRKNIAKSDWIYEKREEYIRKNLTKEQYNSYCNMLFMDDEYVNEFLSECFKKNNLGGFKFGY